MPFGWRWKMPLRQQLTVAAIIIYCCCCCMMSPASAQSFETGDNSTVIGCSTHCAYTDPTLSCWNETLYFFERLLLGHMRHYVAVQMNIDQWRRRHHFPYEPAFEESKRASIAKMTSHLQHDDIVNASTVETMVNALVDLAALQSNHTLTWIPHFSCPIPCEYRYVVWRNLFIASTILNICLFIAILPFVNRMAKNDFNEGLITRD